MHVGGAFVDAADLGGAIELLNGVVLHKTITAEELHALAGDTLGHLGHKVLGHRGFFGVRQAGCFAPCGVVDHQPASFDLGGHLRE